MEWKSGFLNDPSSSRCGKSNGPAVLRLGPLQDRRSRDRELQMPACDERIPTRFLQGAEVTGGGGAAGWGSSATTSSTTNGAGGWGQSVTSTDTTAPGSSSGWGAAWRETIKNGTAIESTTSEQNRGWGTPYTGDRNGRNSNNGWGTVSAAASNGGNVAANENEGSTNDDDMAANDPALPGSIWTLDRLFRFNAIISNVPKQCLEKWYNREHEIIALSKSCYNTWNMNPDTPHEPKFVSIFTSPIDGEIFLSGRWKGSRYSTLEMESVDGRMIEISCYSKKVNAEHAAAGRALDSLSFRKFEGKERYDYCLDEPYMGPESAPALPRSTPTDATIASTTDKGTAAAAATIAATRIAPPKALLQNWYMERFCDTNQGNTKFSDYFECWNNGDEKHKLWTCVFTELVSGSERFASGRWGNGDNPKYEVISERGIVGGAIEEADVVWYTTKKNAEHAAAARALDCLRIRENDSSSRLCLEEPYLSGDDAPPLPPSTPPPRPDPLPTLSTRRLPKTVPMDTDEQVQERQEYRSSRSAPVMMA